MGEYGETRHGEATPQRAERDNTTDNAVILPQEHFTRIRHAGQGRIEALLGRGQEAALSQAELERITGLPRRTIRRMIEAERQALVPILSDENGYYMPDDEAEAARFISGMRRRAHEILNNARCVERAIEQAQFAGNLFDQGEAVCK